MDMHFKLFNSGRVLLLSYPPERLYGSSLHSIKHYVSVPKGKKVNYWRCVNISKPSIRNQIP